MKYSRIIFVSMNNTCRGPIAESIMKNITVHKDLEIISRGIIVLFSEPCNPKATAVLRNMGIILGNRTSVELQGDEITEDTLVLALGLKEKEQLIEKYDPANVYTIPEFVGEAGELQDPYGKDMDEYMEYANSLERWLKRLDAMLDGGKEEV